MDDLTPWFVMGFIISGLIMVIVPDDFFGSVMPTGWVSMVMMLFIGVPMYICATASTPVAAALLAKGMDPGAALVLLLAGPATNIATITVVSNFLGKRVLQIYLGGIAISSLLLGAFVNWLYEALGIDPATIVDTTPVGDEGWLGLAGGVILTGLVVASAVRIGLHKSFAKRLRRYGAPLGIDPTSPLARAGWAVLLLGMWGSTAVTGLESGVTGFRLRFGRIVSTHAEPGLILHAPYPFESVERVRMDEVRGVDFGFLRSDASGEAEREVSPRQLAEESELICGDETMLKVTYVVHYSVLDAHRYHFGIADPADLIGNLAEGALRRVCSKQTVDELLVYERTKIEEAVLAELTREVEALQASVKPLAIEFLEVHAPPAVHEAFRDVASAIEDKEKRLRRAERYASERLTKARGTAFRLEQEAQRDATRVLEEARGRVNAFDSIRSAHAEAPLLNSMRLRLDAAARSLDSSRLVLIVGEGIAVELWRRHGRDDVIPDVFGETGR